MRCGWQLAALLLPACSVREWVVCVSPVYVCIHSAFVCCYALESERRTLCGWGQPTGYAGCRCTNATVFVFVFVDCMRAAHSENAVMNGGDVNGWQTRHRSTNWICIRNTDTIVGITGILSRPRMSVYYNFARIHACVFSCKLTNAVAFFQRMFGLIFFFNFFSSNTRRTMTEFSIDTLN